MSRLSRSRWCGTGRTSSGRQLAAATTTALVDDTSTCAGTHARAEAVLAVPTAVVRLEGALHGRPSRGGMGAHGGRSSDRTALCVRGRTPRTQLTGGGPEVYRTTAAGAGGPREATCVCVGQATAATSRAPRRRASAPAVEPPSTVPNGRIRPQKPTFSAVSGSSRQQPLACRGPKTAAISRHCCGTSISRCTVHDRPLDRQRLGNGRRRAVRPPGRCRSGDRARPDRPSGSSPPRFGPRGQRARAEFSTPVDMAVDACVLVRDAPLPSAPRRRPSSPGRPAPSGATTVRSQCVTPVDARSRDPVE